MPRKDPESQREYMREWYARGSGPKERALARKARYQARNKAFLLAALARQRTCGGCGSADPNHCSRWEEGLYRLARRPVSLARLEAALRECSEVE